MDILDEMTKKEIIMWLRGQFSYMMKPPKKYNVLFMRWQLKEEELSGRRRKHLAYGESLNFKKRDEYARKFNSSTDTEERLSLLKKMKPYEDKWRKYIKESEAISKEDKKIDKLYDQIDIERKKEQVK